MAKGTCSIDDCDRPVYSRGWCTKHYQRWYKHGDPNWEPVTRLVGADNPAWTGDDATYDGMHQRVKTKYGRPSDYACVDCGAQATDWSLQHDADPAKLRSQLINRCVIWYSLDVEDYAPRCKKCHVGYDWAVVVATRPRRRSARGTFLPRSDGDG